MASPQRPQPAHLGSDGDQKNSILDERKIKRMMLERLSVRRSRMRKQQQLDGQINQLQNDINIIMQKIDGATQLFVGVSSENNVLRAQLTDLSDRLDFVNSVLCIGQEVSVLAMDISEIPDTWPDPWRLPYFNQPITTSTNMNMFQY